MKWESVRVFGLDQSLVPGYQFESYDLVRRGGPSIGGDPIPEGMPITKPSSMLSVRRSGTVRPPGPRACPALLLITVPDATYYIQNQRQDAVVAAIRQAIAGT